MDDEWKDKKADNPELPLGSGWSSLNQYLRGLAYRPGRGCVRKASGLYDCAGHCLQ